MMQETDWERLTENLAELGFTKPNMQSYLEGCAGMDKIDYYQRARYGDDEMSWQMSIAKDKQTDLYYPKGFQATLLQTHPVRHGYFEGIDTHELEQRIKHTDWQKFLYGTARIDRQASSIIDDVMTLAASKDVQARDVSKRLQLRYWLHSPVEQHVNIVIHAAEYQRNFYFPLR